MNTVSNTLSATPQLRSGDWKIDKGRSAIRFHTKSMFGAFPVRGRFDRFDGALHVDESGRASGRLTIEASSISTGIGMRDWHLRSKDFFHASSEPQLTFTLDGLEPDGDAHAVSGVLRIRDASLPVRAPATLSTDDSEITIEARFEVDHHAAGLGWAKPGMVPKSVEADVQLTLSRA